MSDKDIQVIKAICARVSIEDKQEILRIILSTTSMEIREDARISQTRCYAFGLPFLWRSISSSKILRL